MTLMVRIHAADRSSGRRPVSVVCVCSRVRAISKGRGSVSEASSLRSTPAIQDRFYRKTVGLSSAGNRPNDCGRIFNAQAVVLPVTEPPLVV